MAIDENIDKQIKSIIEMRIADVTAFPDIQRLMMLSAGRVHFNRLRSIAAETPNWNEYNPVFKGFERQKLSHIADWLKAAIVNDADWLKNVDDQGRPKKLMKFSNIDQITAEADKAMMIASQQGKNIKLDENEEKLIHTFEDGYYLVQMLTASALDRESAFMQHCIGNGGYDHKVTDDKYRYLSLRDASNKPHATIECDKRSSDGNWRVLQLQGKQNQMPLAKYCDYLVPYLENEKYEITFSVIDNLPYIQDEHGKIHKFVDLPAKMKCINFTATMGQGHLEIGKSELTNELRMPDDLKVICEFQVNFHKVTNFPKIIDFKMNKVEFIGCEFTSFPEHVYVDGKLSIRAGILSSAPQSIHSTGNVFIDLLRASEFPQRISSASNIVLQKIPLETFDCEISTPHQLTIRKSSIKSLPKEIQASCLVLIDVPVTELPADLDINQLQIEGTNISGFPEGIRIRERITLDVMDIETFPDSIADDVELIWTKKVGIGREEIEGPRTVGEFREMILAPSM